jgi:hypothetical protein
VGQFEALWESRFHREDVSEIKAKPQNRTPEIQTLSSPAFDYQALGHGA